MTFLKSLENRRSIYALGKNIENPDQAIETIKQAVRLSPSAFNSQTTRVLFVTGAAQEKLWGEIVADAVNASMKAQGVPESAFEGTKAKLDGFKAAY